MTMGLSMSIQANIVKKCAPRLGWPVTVLLLALFLAGCAGPVGVTRISPTDSYIRSTANPLSQGEISNTVAAVLHRYNRLEVYKNDPVGTIQYLHERSQSDERRDLLFALAELSYRHGETLVKAGSATKLALSQDYFLQTALYAYYFLLGEGREELPSAYDIRFREACDLYNRSLWRAFPANADGSLQINGGDRQLPVGKLSLIINPAPIKWAMADITGMFPSDAYQIRGFSVRNRTPGLGLPLSGTTRKTTDAPNGGILPITAFLRLPGGIRTFHGGATQAVLELYSAYDSTAVEVNGKIVPIETDSTTPLAFRLNDSELWNAGITRFLTGDRVNKRMLLMQPYQAGRIPVVFVHGTASSPAWWAEMLNTLRADPDIRRHFQFWFYQYNSSNMIVVSAAEMREVIADMVQKLDPQQQDPALQQMVIIGHSQGGLLTKMTAIEPENSLWRAVSDAPLEELKLDPEVADLARRSLFFSPLPFVKRVVFISTPHRGSFLTKDWVRNIISKTITLPLNLTQKGSELFSNSLGKLKLPAKMRGKIPSSIDGMSSDNPVLQALVTIPLRPGVVGHSIISVKPGMDLASGNDGVVEYNSAHLEGVESELVVRSGHSCQEHPFTIEEVRRILREHVNLDSAAPAVAGGSGVMALPGQSASQGVK